MTTIYLNETKLAYRREQGTIAKCKKSDFIALLEDRRVATIIVAKHQLQKYDRMLQKARYYMTDIEPHNNFEVKVIYKAF